MNAPGRPTPAKDAALEKWKTAFLVVFALAWLVRGLDWLLDLPDDVRLALQVPLLLVAVVCGAVVVSSWFARLFARRTDG